MDQATLIKAWNVVQFFLGFLVTNIILMQYVVLANEIDNQFSDDSNRNQSTSRESIIIPDIEELFQRTLVATKQEVEREIFEILEYVAVHGDEEEDMIPTNTRLRRGMTVNFCRNTKSNMWCNQVRSKNLCHVKSLSNRCRTTCAQCAGVYYQVGSKTNHQELTTVSTTTASKGFCSDKISSCKSYRKRGYCTKGQFVSYMNVNCPYSCNTCDEESVTTPTTTTSTTTTIATTTRATRKHNRCADKSGFCKAWKRFGYCHSKRYQKYMRSNCMLSCGICSPRNTIQECGKPMISLNYEHIRRKRIVGGQNSVYGSIPWQASIFYGDNNICGGALISDQHIITAAHCFGGNVKPSPLGYYVYFGKHHKHPDHVDKGQVRRDVVSIRVHDNYNHAKTLNDIAIIKIKWTVPYTDFIRPVCLPSQDEQLEPETPALVSGWGETDAGVNDDGEPVDVLQDVDVKVISNDRCNEMLFKVSGAIEVDDNMLCAGHFQGIKDACQGDSGGPLVTKKADGSGHQLIGVVSWGYGCGNINRPGVYTRIPRFTNWIQKEMR